MGPFPGFLRLRRLLVRFIRKRDGAAFAAFAEAVWPFLCAWGFRVLLDRQMAEDAAQEALIRVLRAVRNPLWKPKRSMKSWLWTILWRVAIDLLRKRRRQTVLQSQANLPNGESSPLEALMGKELRESVRVWLKVCATPRERYVLYCYYFEGLSLKEIGRGLRPRKPLKPPRVLRMRRRAEARLAEYLGEGYLRRHLVEDETNG